MAHKGRVALLFYFPHCQDSKYKLLLYCHNCHFKRLLILYWTFECCNGRGLSSCPFLCVPSPSLSITKEAQVIACSEKPFICGALPPRTNRQKSIIVLRWVKKRNPYPICKSFQIWKARWVSASVSLNLIYKGRILNMAEKIHTIICANILKSHWIYPFNIAHLHASKEPEFYL